VAYEEGLHLAHLLHDEERQCAILADLGWQMHLAGNLERAEAYVEEGMVLALAHALPEPLVVLLKTRGSMAWMRGKYHQANAACLEGVHILEEVDGPMRKDLSTFYCLL